MSETTVVCKFIFSAMKTELDYKKRKVYSLEFHPVAGDSEENKKFWEATPSGVFNFQTINEEAAKFFEFGHEYLCYLQRSESSARQAARMTSVNVY